MVRSLFASLFVAASLAVTRAQNNATSLFGTWSSGSGAVITGPVQDPCGPQSEVLTYYSQFELYNGWEISVDLHHETYVLQLYRFDGSLYPRLYLTMRPPSMLPTVYLTAI
ncbi:Reversal of tor2 lethality [Microbotryomycetes sp. JL201]|nr:Reversal of tor2 lethality [Microbotryomycetes sp. JL201]